jgi:hypothetical protein
VGRERLHRGTGKIHIIENSSAELHPVWLSPNFRSLGMRTAKIFLICSKAILDPF